MDNITVTLSQNLLINISQNNKRPSRPDQWKRNVIKKKKVMGQAYNNHGGRLVPAKIPPIQPRACKRCNLQGCGALDLIEKRRLFETYYGLQTYNEQRTYLLGLIDYHQNENNPIYRYHLRVRGVRQPVCKVNFMDTFKITRDVLKTIKRALVNDCLVISVKRGTHENRAKNPEELKDLIRNFVDAQPKIQNHYSRKRNPEVYLEPNANVDRLYRKFRDEHPEIPNVEKKKNIFRQVFNRMGVAIAQPKSDTCKLCDVLHMKTKSGTAQEQQTANAELMKHHVEAELARKELKSDFLKSREVENYVVLVIDLQQVLFCPTLTNSEIFYKRQLSTYNYCIVDGQTGQGNMFVWNETLARRGSDEVGSIVFKYLKTNFRVLQNNEYRKLIIWSDRCRGQTNNFLMLSLAKFLISQKLFTTVDQKFLITGHSFNPCDEAFGIIEKEKRKSTVYIPEQWVDVIARSKSEDSVPFRVTLLEQGDILDFAPLLLQVPKPSNLKVTNYLWYSAEGVSPNAIFCRSSFLPVATEMFEIKERGRRRVQNLPDWNGRELANLVLRRKYNLLIPISRAKYNDLLSMLSTLPPEFHEYYSNLPVE